MAKNEGGIIGFGSTYRIHETGALIFVNAPFPVLEEDQRSPPERVIGKGYAGRLLPAGRWSTSVP